ncbi:hypothetical protein ABGB07_28065 [Micromonosporaceae bacterium B7E4]
MARRRGDQTFSQEQLDTWGTNGTGTGTRNLGGPLFDGIGKRTLWVGDDGASGAASSLNLVLNTWVIALTHGVGEALALAKALDVDPAHFVDVVTGGPMDNGYFPMESKAILRSPTARRWLWVQLNLLLEAAKSLVLGVWGGCHAQSYESREMRLPPPAIRPQSRVSELPQVIAGYVPEG